MCRLVSKNLEFTEFSCHSRQENPSVSYMIYIYNFFQIVFQVEKAYDFLTNFSKVKECNVQFLVTIPSGHRGIYIRDVSKLDKINEISVSVELAYLENKTGKYSQNLFVILKLTPVGLLRFWEEWFWYDWLQCCRKAD